MTREGRVASAAEELGRADEELRAATELVRLMLFRIALTRAYYAVFHAMRALLFSEGQEPRSHHGVVHLFNTSVVKTGRLPADTSARIARLQKYREEADYSEAFVVDPVTTEAEVNSASELVARIRVLIPPA